MSKKKWALLVLVILLLLGYFKFFYKTYSEKVVAGSADYIAALDVKRITNTLLWDLITTPGRWKIGKLFSKKIRELNWQDMLELPDYILAFHVKDQPANAWYMQLEIKDETDFEKGLTHFEFEKISSNEYISKKYAVHFLRHDNKVLVANAAVKNRNLIKEVANELFTKKSFISKPVLSKAIRAKSHLAVFIAANGLLQEDGMIKANFDKEKIEISSMITPGKQYYFTESGFKYNSKSLGFLGFTQPPATALALLEKDLKEKISTALSINTDSFFRQSNTSYSLNLAEIKTRADSAISFIYDEEFNKIEKVVVNNIREPSFDFGITGSNVSGIYNYLQQNNKLENTGSGDVFLPMPLVRSYCSKKDESRLAITSFNFSEALPDRSVQAVFFLHLVPTKIPGDLLKYLPGGLAKSLENISEISLLANKKDEQVLIKGVFMKKDNEQPLAGF